MAKLQKKITGVFKASVEDGVRFTFSGNRVGNLRVQRSESELLRKEMRNILDGNAYWEAESR